ncbi:GSU2403 family nucleotidyltransferase fold protein [Bosea rubneri]|uniref:GSU2403 family nucleotidyltransferase fold protein n=1 Tax=Bosea rubneri TaxID=3075434 RepID=A0ABU3SAA7_9HYPH|nr:GSU2403 family nucleotidyltransferase fold protein [Bosea sp. ZW T0_25]MDU0341725.1 GSU2403 family nucleotidyltransferase fold protein [Bosea sp. ZW T0_25]
MQRIPLNIQTLYADLQQQVAMASQDEATVVATTVAGIRYLRLQRWVGASRTVEHLGRADDPEVLARADTARAEMARRQERRRLVSALRRLIPGPTNALGRVADAVAHAGLFRRGAVLVGTAAYQCYPPLLGMVLPSATVMTQDLDLATADLALDAEIAGDSMLAILQRAEASFAALPGLDPKAPPSRFRDRQGFVVDLLTPQRRRSDRDPMPLKALAAGATPLQHLDWLIEDPVSAVALHGAGVAVVLPRPARFAVHKLILAQKRGAHEPAKARKDLAQAAALVEALRVAAPFELDDAIEDARSRGRDGWARPLDRSLSAIGVTA